MSALDSPELAQQVDERQTFHDRPTMGADLPKLGFRPLSQERLHLLCGEVLAEPGGALAGQRFGEVFAAGERVEGSEERGLGIRDGLGHGRDTHSTLSERLEPEPQGLQLYLEVRHLGRQVLGQPGDDGAQKRDSLSPGVLGEPLLQDALVRPVLVEDDQLFAFLGEPEPYVVV